MDQQSIDVKNQVKTFSYKDKLKYFWYYYKIHMIILLVALLVIISSAVSCANQIKYDLEVSFFTSYGMLDEDIDYLTNVIKEHSYDINGNDSVDIKIFQQIANIVDEGEMDEMSRVVLTKMEAQLSANSCPGYIMDQSYKDLLMEVFPDGIKSAIEISKIPEIKENLKYDENKPVYWVTMNEYEKDKDKPKMIKKYELVQKIEEYFKGCLDE